MNLESWSLFPIVKVVGSGNPVRDGVIARLCEAIPSRWLRRRLLAMTITYYVTITKLCSRCGHLNNAFTLTGQVKDRDLNAAENLHRAGLARIHACGHDGSVSVPRETEATSMEETGSQSGAVITIAHS